MSSHVYFQVIRLSKRFLTYMAFAWFFTSMGSHVLFQITRLSKRFQTYLAFPGFFASIGSQVPFESTLFRKWFMTHLAPVWRISSMGSHVLCQIVLVLRVKKFDHISTAIQDELQWLRIGERINFKPSA